MARPVNWYLDGWVRHKELTPTGKVVTIWNYQGAYYTYGVEEKQLKRLKISYVVCGLLLILGWFALGMSSAKGKDAAFYVGAPWFLCMLPLMELFLGMVGMRSASNKMTYRDMYAGYKRLLYGVRGCLPLMAISAVGEIVFLCIYRTQLRLLFELLWLLGVLVLVAVNAVLLVLQSRYRPWLIPKE